MAVEITFLGAAGTVTGSLPKLCSLGFSGRVHCTQGTRDLLQILLPDSGYLQEEEARHANKWRHTRHNPALPLYTQTTPSMH